MPIKDLYTVTGCAECLNKENVEVLLEYWDLDGLYHAGKSVYEKDRCPRCGSTQLCHYNRKGIGGIWNADSAPFSKWSRGEGAARRPIPGPRE